MNTEGVPRRLSPVLGLAALALGLCLTLGLRSQAEPGLIVEFEEKSQFSKIRITREKSVRTLWFVQESGDGLVESRVDLDRPHDMLVEYTRYMFLSYLFRPKPEKVLNGPRHRQADRRAARRQSAARRCAGVCGGAVLRQ